MKQTYMIRDPEKDYRAAAIADVVPLPTKGLKKYSVITRINVHTDCRGQGYGTKILDEILADADREGVVLFLEPVPSGGLDQGELEQWYKRHGFSWGAWHMKRKPR